MAAGARAAAPLPEATHPGWSVAVVLIGVAIMTVHLGMAHVLHRRYAEQEKDEVVENENDTWYVGLLVWY